MSNWTHVAGIIRIDALGDKFDADKLFGKEIHFDDPIDEWRYALKHKHEYMPMGTEGSLYKSVWVNPRKSHMDRYTVSVFGDLRDHDDADEIVEWFKNICNKLGYSVRNATITVRNELNGMANWTHSGEEE